MDKVQNFPYKVIAQFKKITKMKNKILLEIFGVYRYTLFSMHLFFVS